MTVAAERRKADQRVEKARSAGYSAGSSDGYSRGNEDGYDEGLTAGSDDLTCSDDPDVTWLHYCNESPSSEIGRRPNDRVPSE